MKLTTSQVSVVTAAALARLGKKRQPGFHCVDFIRAVFAEAGVRLYRLKPTPPPAEISLSLEELRLPPPGKLLFLKDRQAGPERAWTHVALTMPNRQVIHNSYFYGEQVVLTKVDDLWERYEFVPPIRD